MANITLTVEEYNKLKEQADKVPQLEEAVHKKGYCLVTRYDRDLDPNNPIVDSYVDFIWETYYRNNGDTECRNGGWMMPEYGEDLFKHRKIVLKEAIKSFITQYINTTKRNDFSKVSSKLINFEDVEKEIKEVYNHKYFEEFGERINKFKENEAKLQHDIDTFEENNQERIKSLEARIKKLQDFEWKHYNDEKKIKDQEIKICDLNSQLNLYRDTVMDQKEEIERLTKKRR